MRSLFAGWVPETEELSKLSWDRAAAAVVSLARDKAAEERRLLLARGMSYSFVERAVAEGLGWTPENCNNHSEMKGYASCLRCGCYIAAKQFIT